MFVLLANQIVYCSPVDSKSKHLRVPVGDYGRVEKHLNDNQDSTAAEQRKFKFLNKIKRKTKIALAIGLAVLIIGGLAYKLTYIPEDKNIVIVSPYVSEETVTSDTLYIREHIWEAVDQYNSPSQWRACFINYGEGYLDLSSFSSLKFEFIGEGYIVAQLVDFSRRNAENWQGGVSRVYKIEPGKKSIVINMSEFLESDPDLDLRKINKIVINVGRDLWDVKLNLKNTNTFLVRASPSIDSLQGSYGTAISLHDSIHNEIIKKTMAEQERILKAEEKKIIKSEEFKILSSGDFSERLNVVDNLKNKLSLNSEKERLFAIAMLRFSLMDSSQNTNLRRHIYYLLKDIAGVEIADETLEDFITNGPRLKEPFVMELPLIWYRNGIDYFKYPDWDGNIVMKRFTGNGIQYGTERIITHDSISDESSFTCILDRNIMKRLAYWSIIMGIDPMKITYPIVYTETLLGMHPEKTYNIMAIHVADLSSALDPRGVDIRNKLLDKYAKSSEDLFLDKIITTGLILAEQGFNRFPNSEDLALRLQGYNGYGINPAWRYIKMRDEPMIGKRAVYVAGKISKGPLVDIAKEVSEELKIEIPELPKDVAGYRIRITFPEIFDSTKLGGIIKQKVMDTSL